MQLASAPQKRRQQLEQQCVDSRAGPAEILADYRGVMLTDGFSGYESLVQESAGRLSAAACWMHARREFDEARVTSSHALVEETLVRRTERAKPIL